ncbi:hypothetical protein N7507_002969 [Penicillium longicatenatum]|nr:hypothetical protein N7507_002969 [Penicillium longicatenatum]
MASMEFNYFPTEVLMLIADYVYDLATYMEDASNRVELEQAAELQRQNTLYNFCLVSHQWYSVGVELLYRKPSISNGNRFLKFTQSVCPPIKTKNKTKSDRGSMIQVLDLGRLVHQSSNSVTARLLSKASENMVSLTAPRVSFSLNGLAALAKCQNLHNLDLSRVGDSSLSFPQLKKAISKLTNLRKLSLPIYIPLTRTLPTTSEWPTRLLSLTIGGHIDPDLMKGFDWPPNLMELHLSNCRNVDVTLLHNILSNVAFQESLELFAVKPNCKTDGLFYNEGTGVLDDLYALENLEIPANLIRSLLLMKNEIFTAFSFKTLWLTEPEGGVYPNDQDGVVPGDSPFVEDFIESLKKGPLSELWELAAPYSFLEHYGLDPDMLDEIVSSHLDDVEDAELDEWGTDFGFQILG